MTSSTADIRPAGTVLITGASRGLGRALADAYAEEGWRVIACMRQVPADGSGQPLDVARILIWLRGRTEMRLAGVRP